MKTLICILLTGLLPLISCGEEFTRAAFFKSTQAFAAAAKAFKPAQSESDLKPFFTIHEEASPLATADSVDTCEIMWESDTKAIAFAASQPPTNYTIWKIGILFLLVHTPEGWHISDLHRFDAQNKNADITCVLTSGERAETIVTVTEHQGRLDFWYELSASYSCPATKLERHDLE